jgi:sugar phosphate isomerase/epimerase
MAVISAFADEIDPDLKTQMDVCEANGVRCIDVRAIDGTNVSQFTVDQAREYRRRMADRGFEVPCLGSPIGKVRIDEPFEPHLDLLKHCFEVARAFDCSRIRMFSFYPPEGGKIADHRDEVIDRLGRMAAAAEDADIVLLHENEGKIYGEGPDGVKDIFASVTSPALKGIFDPANFVVAGFRPLEDCWQAGLAELTDYFHIKDKDPARPACVPAGEGHGQISEILADAKARDFDGYLTLEPHMKKAGQFAGETGPELFGRAVAGLKKVCDQVGLAYR